MKRAKPTNSYEYSVKKRRTGIHIFKIKKRVRRRSRVDTNEHRQI